MKKYSGIFDIDGGGDLPSELISAIVSQNYLLVHNLVVTKRKLQPLIVTKKSHIPFLTACNVDNPNKKIKIAIIKLLADKGADINGNNEIGNAIDNCIFNNEEGLEKFDIHTLLYLLKLKIKLSVPIFQSLLSRAFGIYDYNAIFILLEYGKVLEQNGIQEKLKLRLLELERILPLSLRDNDKIKILDLDFKNKDDVNELADELLSKNKILYIVSKIIKNEVLIDDLIDPVLPEINHGVIVEPFIQPFVDMIDKVYESPKSSVTEIIPDVETSDEIIPSIRTLIRAPTTRVDEVTEEKNKFELIQETLAQFGLAELTLDHDRSILNYFGDITSDIMSNANKIGLFTGTDENLEFSRTKSTGEKITQKFDFVKNLASGSFNKTMIYHSNDTEYIIRKCNHIGPNYQYISFYENIKHIILYVLIRKFIGKIKFIPKPFFMGFRILPSNQFEILFVMEKGEMILEDYMRSIFRKADGQKKITKIFFKIYRNYNELLKLKINFKHSDFKLNNIVVTKSNNPLIIDFGFSTFTISDAGKSISFKAYEFDHRTGNRNYLLFTKYPEDSMFGYNLVHDMLQLISSSIWIYGFNPYTIFNFKKNRDCIFDGHHTKWFLSITTGESESGYRKFYSEIDLLKLLPRMVFPDGDRLKLYITPEELAKNLELEESIDEIECELETFDKKYLKYGLNKDSSKILDTKLDILHNSNDFSNFNYMEKNVNIYKTKYLKYKTKYTKLKTKIAKNLETQILEAINTQNLELLNRLIIEEKSMNIFIDEKTSYLFISHAIQNSTDKKLDIIKLLLDNGALVYPEIKVDKITGILHHPDYEDGLMILMVHKINHSNFDENYKIIELLVKAGELKKISNISLTRLIFDILKLITKIEEDKIIKLYDLLVKNGVDLVNARTLIYNYSLISKLCDPHLFGKCNDILLDRKKKLNTDLLIYFLNLGVDPVNGPEIREKQLAVTKWDYPITNACTIGDIETIILLLVYGHETFFDEISKQLKEEALRVALETRTRWKNPLLYDDIKELLESKNSSSISEISDRLFREKKISEKVYLTIKHHPKIIFDRRKQALSLFKL